MVNKFFTTVDGKPKPYKFDKDEYELYKDICFTIWGGMPHDVGWAISTQIYQNEYVRRQSQAENS